MITMTSTGTRRTWGRVVEKARKNPVVVEKDGRPVVAVISYEDFERFQELEDRIWGERASAVREKGDYIGTEESMKLLQRGLEE